MVPLWADIMEKTRRGEFLEVPINKFLSPRLFGILYGGGYEKFPVASDFMRVKSSVLPSLRRHRPASCITAGGTGPRSDARRVRRSIHGGPRLPAAGAAPGRGG